MPSFPVPVLGSLFVSFRPSRLRSHSCFTGASLLLSLSGFPLTSAFFRPLPLGSDYSAFRSFLSLLPAFPCRRFPRCFFPLPSGLFPCLPSDSGTRLAAIPFSARRLASQQLPLRLSLLPFGFRPLPLAFALGSGYSALGRTLSGASHSLQTCRPQRTNVYYHTSIHLSIPFWNFLNFCPLFYLI